MKLTFTKATAADASALVALRNAAAQRLTREFGHGHWSSAASEKGVVNSMQHGRVLLARDGARLVGTLRLATKKPWAIDKTYFVDVPKALYLVDMAVDPSAQRQGVGRACLAEGMRLAAAWPSDSIRLDAYDHAAGAADFYAKCGFNEVGRVTYRGVPLVYFERVL